MGTNVITTPLSPPDPSSLQGPFIPALAMNPSLLTPRFILVSGPRGSKGLLFSLILLAT